MPRALDAAQLPARSVGWVGAPLAAVGRHWCGEFRAFCCPCKSRDVALLYCMLARPRSGRGGLLLGAPLQSDGSASALPLHASAVGESCDVDELVYFTNPYRAAVNLIEFGNAKPGCPASACIMEATAQLPASTSHEHAWRALPKPPSLLVAELAELAGHGHRQRDTVF